MRRIFRSVGWLWLPALAVAVGVWQWGGSSGVAAPSAPAVEFCPRSGFNPPHRVQGLTQIVSIAFAGSRLLAADAHGDVWSYFRGESNCADPPPLRVIDARRMPPSLLGTGEKIVEVTAAALRTDRGHVILGGYWEMPVRCDEHSCGVDRLAIDGVVSIAAGNRHLLALRENGEVWSRGMNDCGQLGRAEPSDAFAKRILRIDDAGAASAIAAGMRSSLLLDRNGVVWTWGNLSHPYFGSVGGTQPVPGWAYCPGEDREWAGHRLSAGSRFDPQPVRALPKIRQISGYYATDLALAEDGSVWGWGYNLCGQLGRSPGQGDVLDYFFEQPVRIGGLPPVRSIAVGKRHALALDGDGGVWAWGENRDTELGQRLDLSKVGYTVCVSEYEMPQSAPSTSRPYQVPGIGKATQIAAGYNSSAALDEHGDVWVWGRH